VVLEGGIVTPSIEYSSRARSVLITGLAAGRDIARVAVEGARYRTQQVRRVVGASAWLAREFWGLAPI
jgi:hypothetical protein